MILLFIIIVYFVQVLAVRTPIPGFQGNFNLILLLDVLMIGGKPPSLRGHDMLLTLLCSLHPISLLCIQA